MKKISLLKRLPCLIVLLCLLAAMPLLAFAEEAPIPWLTYTLDILYCTDEPTNIEGNPALVDERCCVVTFTADKEKILISDIIDNIEMFSVADPEGNEFVAAAYFPYSMMYLSVPGVFSTAPLQGKFDLLFVIPTSVNADSLTLYVEQTPGGERTSRPLADSINAACE